MDNKIDFLPESNNCSPQQSRIEGCSNGNSYLVVVCSSDCGDTTSLKYINISDGVVEDVPPPNFQLGNCSEIAQNTATSPDWNPVPIDYVPSSSGNTNNLNSFVVDPNGDIYFIDKDGESVKFARPETVTSLVDNGDGTFTYTNELGESVTINACVVTPYVEKVTEVVFNENGTASYINEENTEFIIDQFFDVLGTVEPTPTATGNTTNLNSIFKDVNGDTWAVDSLGNAIKIKSAITGDIYKTTSETCNDIVSNGNLTFTVATGLAYTPFQDIIITADASNHMHGEVVSYNSVTGELVVLIHQKEGSGNYCNWTINLDAIKLSEVSVYFGTTDPTTAGQVGIEGDFWYKTTDGTSAGSILETYVYDGTEWILVSNNLYTNITSLVPKVYQTGGYVDAQANTLNNTADAFLLSDGTYIEGGTLKIEGHGYTVGKYYYLSQTTAGAVTDVYPASGIVQQLFFVHDANTLLVDIEQAIDPEVPSFANTVYVNSTDVNNGTIYDLNNPPTTNNNALKADVNNLYIGTDGSVWVWNGTSYVTKEIPNNTEWYLQGTTVDAGGNKTSVIYRLNGIGVGTDKVYGNITSKGGVAFNVIPEYGIASIGRIQYSSGWQGSGFVFANQTAGSGAFSMVFNSDKAYFGRLKPSNQHQVWFIADDLGVAFNSQSLMDTTPQQTPSARVVINSTTQGFLPPRMTTAQINAIVNPATGLVVFNTTIDKLCIKEASGWKQVTTTAM